MSGHKLMHPAICAGAIAVLAAFQAQAASAPDASPGTAKAASSARLKHRCFMGGSARRTQRQLRLRKNRARKTARLSPSCPTQRKAAALALRHARRRAILHRRECAPHSPCCHRSGRQRPAPSRRPARAAGDQCFRKPGNGFCYWRSSGGYFTDGRRRRSGDKSRRRHGSDVRSVD